MMPDLLPDWREAAQKLEQELVGIFGQMKPIPETNISGVHSAGHAEDGSFLLMLDCDDDSIMFVTATPGEPLRVCVQQHPH